ncbi:MAG: DUF1275 domain-containing protein [Ruminococcus sp.]|nr:DUF1275 domain-containing protein [Ruminococcus sp.]
MKKIVRRQMLAHYAAAMIGGFWGGYTIFNYLDIFANAQTGNLIKLVLDLCEGDLTFVWFMALSFLVYCGGNVFYVLVRRKVRLSMKIVSMICSAAAVVVIGVIALARGGVITCFPIMFVAPIQWNAFKIAGGNSSSTIFSSNNVRQAAILTTNYVLSRDKSTGGKARFYWLTLLSFHIGVALAGCTSLFAGVHSIWFCFVPIALTVCAYYYYISEKLRVASLVNAGK